MARIGSNSGGRRDHDSKLWCVGHASASPRMSHPRTPHEISPGSRAARRADSTVAEAARDGTPWMCVDREQLGARRRFDPDDAQQVTTTPRGRIWIDLANTPHVLVFTPVVERLRRDGWEVVLTARDHAQTLELAREQWPDVIPIGGGSPPGRLHKSATLAARTRSLYRFSKQRRPHVALSPTALTHRSSPHGRRESQP